MALTLQILNTCIRSIAVLLAALLVQSAGAQVISGKGFIPDENGTNLDDNQAAKLTSQPQIALGTIFKDCAECPEMVVLPAGSFLMGSPPDPEPDPFSNEKPKVIGIPDEKPQHRVQIQSFAIGKFEVTQEQWYAVMGNNPSANKGRTLPVDNVSWDDIQQLIANLNQKTGQKYRLPSEAEWEYAARAGTTTDWSFGNDASKLGNYAWHGRNSGNKTQEVGQKQPNAFGLYDMHGNVWEWTQDCWHVTYAGAPTDGSAWTTDCRSNARVLRGGSGGHSPAYLRSAIRNADYPNSRDNYKGFRLATDVQRQNALEGDRLRELQAQSDKLLKDQLERAMKRIPSSGMGTQNGPNSAEYGAKVRDAIRPHLLLIKEVNPNLKAEYLVKTVANGKIVDAKLTKSSGDTYFDDVALKAIWKTDRLSPDIDGRVPSPMLIVVSP